MANDHPIISIVVPCYNEQENVRAMIDRLRGVLEPITRDYEIIFINDGSADATSDRVSAAHGEDGRVKLIELSRNFGHQLALMAGLDVASGDAVITIDADLQHPPELIPEMLARWQDGDDVVHAVRQRSGGGGIQRLTSRMSYRLLRSLCEVDILPNAADFRLLDRRVVQVMRQLRERFRFDRGLVRWLGFRQGQVAYQEDLRLGGRPAYRWSQRVRLLGNAVFSLSSRPLSLVGVLGLFVSLGAAAYLVFVLATRLLAPDRFGVQSGWASTMAMILLFGGVQLVAIWLLGQYVGRTYEETKQRPPYVIARGLGLEGPGIPRTTRPRLEIPGNLLPPSRQV
ncbi:MAG: glycosyltransferase family 2 protein [Phycisphaerae bacterium]|nr:glycosyltransferase family 2 protein [Phycisphaerae bacterium]